ncbi:MAG: hypothetical protein IPN95_20615 [Bacteroidetes bacterium]|nr:hypothetical protein [Bacteroidota bacterium]MBL0018326.1 hypothetical protein [Bacteroidota bacterium]MBP6639125.1 hypothetical protein [Bacteroidia bacterium]MBP6720969.1 hypothetical protein [Bacteroidia bacterium]
MRRLLNYLTKDTKVSQNPHTPLGSFGDSKTKVETFSGVFQCLRNSILDFVKEAREQSLWDEPNLTQLLVQNLMDEVKEEWLPFYFLRENLERGGGNSPSNDFAAYMFRPKRRNQPRQDEQNPTRIPIIRFEAKRLDNRIPPSRMKEYAIGSYAKPQKPENTGGIERFKNLTHGRNDSDAALVAYIQTDDVSTWLSKVNSWIDAEIAYPNDPVLVWQEEDKLLEATAKSLFLDEFTSRSQRPLGAPIHLHHFWIRMYQAPT